MTPTEWKEISTEQLLNLGVHFLYQNTGFKNVIWERQEYCILQVSFLRFFMATAITITKQQNVHAINNQKDGNIKYDYHLTLLSTNPDTIMLQKNPYKYMKYTAVKLSETELA